MLNLIDRGCAIYVKTVRIMTNFATKMYVFYVFLKVIIISVTPTTSEQIRKRIE